MKTLLQDRLSRLYLKALGVWVKDPNAAHVFKNCGRAFEFCLNHQLWSANVIVYSESDPDGTLLSIPEQPSAVLHSTIYE